MKKLFLLGLALASTASMVSAQDYVSGGQKVYKEGYNFSVEWANLDLVGKPGWVALGKRTGVGVNDKFYVNNMDDNTFSIYGPKGFISNIAIPQGFAWAGTSVDQHGNVIMRASSEKWPGTGAYGGCYYPGKTGNLFYFINSETDQLVTSTPAELDAYDGRTDALGFTMGDILSGETPIFLVGDNKMRLAEMYYDEAENSMVGVNYKITINSAFAGTGAGAVKVLGTAQAYGELSADGLYTQLAVSPNYVHDANNGGDVITNNGLRNYIQRYTYGFNPDSQLDEFLPTDEFFVTPQHGGLAGFLIFELGGKQFIAYPVAQASDALAIAELTTVDTPESDDTLDASSLVVRHFAAINETTKDVAYLGAVTAPMTLSYEPVEGEDAVYIYTYCQFGAMMKYKFGVGDGAGIDNVTVDNNADAPVEYYNIDGMRVAHPTAGNIYIRKQGTSVAKVVY